MTRPLSPSAQAVLDAYANELMRPGPLIDGRHPIAAALQAAADRVVPEDCLEHFPNDSAWQGGFIDANERIRLELLAIAAELETSSL